jgi:hypothetical protein
MTDEFMPLGTRAGTAGTRLGAVRRRVGVVLSHMSERLDGPACRGPLARAAERILLAAARRGDRDAVDGIWNAWLRRPDDVRWELLSELFPAAVLAEAVFAAATDPVRDASGRSAIGAFCLRRDMVPAETDAERALFFVLSGQPELHRATDPDGSALAAAHQAAAKPLRAALREATLNSGNPALTRVVAARDRSLVPPADAERSWLVAELAGRREWAGLWRLTLSLPLAETVVAVRRLPGDWRPADQAAWPLLAALTAADPEAMRALTRPAPVRMGASDDEAIDLDIAPDGSEVVTCMTVRGRDVSGRYSPAGGQLLERYHGVSSLVHLGDAVVSVDARRRVLTARYGAGQGTRELARTAEPTYGQLVRAGDGFVVATRDRVLYGTVTGTRLTDITPPGLRLGKRDLVSHLVSEPHAGRAAFAVIRLDRDAPNDVVVLGPDFSAIAVHPGVPPPYSGMVGLCGPGRLITYELYGTPQMGLRSWEVTSSGIRSGATTRLGHARFFRVLSPWRLVIRYDEVARGQFEETAWLDAASLQPVDRPAALTCLPTRMTGLPAVSKDGRCVAFPSGHGELEVHDLLREKVSELIRRPLGDFGHADAVAMTELAGFGEGGTSLAVIGLLQAYLGYRYGSDTGIGLPRGRFPAATTLRWRQQPNAD